MHEFSGLAFGGVKTYVFLSLLQTGEQIHVSLPLSQQVSHESRLSMSESVSEFFDAQEVLLSASSSENEVRSLGAEKCLILCVINIVFFRIR